MRKKKKFIGAPMRTKEDVESYFSGDRIQCLICGKWYCSLATHIIRTHNVSVDEYKERFNLPWTKGLVAENTRDKVRASLIRRINEGDPSVAKSEEELRVMRAAERNFREKKNYDIKRIIDDGRVFNHGSAVERAILVIERIEKEKTSVRNIDKNARGALMAAFKEDPQLRTRYEKALQVVKPGIASRFGKTRSEIKEEALSLRREGFKLREIAEKLEISRTTVKRILYGKDAFVDIE